MSLFAKLKSKTLKTPYGKIKYYWLGGTVFVPRHGIRENTPPHNINHKANMYGLKKLGVSHIFAFSSTGSLKKNIKPGELLLATDYIDLNPPTFFENKAEFITPVLSSILRKKLIKILKKLKIRFRNKGVYFQTKGPRLETKAEINMMKKFADVVAMTMAKEATLAQELGMEYASLCSIDNYAHGIIGKPLAIEEIKKGQKAIEKKFEMIIKEIIATK